LALVAGSRKAGLVSARVLAPPSSALIDSFLTEGTSTAANLSKDLETPLPEEGASIVVLMPVPTSVSVVALVSATTEDMKLLPSAVRQGTVVACEFPAVGLASAGTLVVAITLLSLALAPIAEAVPRVASFFSFNLWLDRRRAEEALVADKRELGALVEGPVDMLTRRGWFE